MDFIRNRGAALILVMALAVTAAAPAAGRGPAPTPSHPRLDANLTTADQPTPGWLEIEVQGRDGRNPGGALAAHGARDLVTVGDIAFATVPVAALIAIGNDPRVTWVRPASRPILDAVIGQGVGATDADTWHAFGVTGSGIDVAIIDGGFFGYPDLQASGDLPLSLETVNFCGSGNFDDSPHGSAVAEIVHEMAPGAKLHLICVDSGGDLALAVDYAIANGISVINESLSWYPPGRGDGTGFLEPILTEAHDAGIVWVNSAGNQGDTHWGGTFVDVDSDGWHDFSGTSSAGEENAFTLDLDEFIFVVLRWDDWPSSSNDYAVYLYRNTGDLLLAHTAGSIGPPNSLHQPQTGTEPPLDWFTYQSTYSNGTGFYIKVQRVAASATPEMDLFVTSNDALENFTAARSLTDPASSPLVTAAGAANHATGVIRSYSSQGPNIVGLIKPEIAGPDGVLSASYGSFAGTSASSPHVAGVVALLRDAAPCLEFAAVNGLMAQMAIDSGTAGPDNAYGAGLLFLDPPGPVADTTGCVHRYSGANRYATAAAIASSDFPDPVTTVFVATGAGFPDGLAGSAVAGRLGAPMLLVDSTGVPAETATELERLSPDTIVVLGGPAVIPEAVVEELAGFAPTVDRVFGSNRYLTAVAISQHGFPDAPTTPSGTVFIATGLNFPDALAAGAAAAKLGGPVLLVPGTTLPMEVAAEILRLDPAKIVIVGGTSAVSAGVLTDVDALQGDDTVTRINGSDRYSTAAAISLYAFPSPDGAPRAYFATGFNFPDALAGGAAAAAWGSPVLLVQGSTVPAVIDAEIGRLSPDLGIALGGNAAISPAAERGLEESIS